MTASFLDGCQFGARNRFGRHGDLAQDDTGGCSALEQVDGAGVVGDAEVLG